MPRTARPILKRNSQALKFVAVGGFAAAVNFFSRALFESFLPFWVAIIFSYFVGMAVAFYLNIRFVFTNSDGTLRNQIWKFFLVNMLSALQVWSISVALQYWLLPALAVTEFREEFAHAIGISFPIFTSYFAHKLWTFR